MTNRASLKDELIATKSFGKKLDPKEESDLITKIAAKTTFENILVYDRTGATALDIAKDFDVIMNGNLDDIISSRFKVVNRPCNEVSFDYIKFAVGCSVSDKDGNILWLKRNSPDLYGKTITGVSGHVSYDDLSSWNSQRHIVQDLLHVVDENMRKEFCEELGIDGGINIYTDWYNNSFYYENQVNKIRFNCYIEPIKDPLTRGRRLVCNTDLYGNSPYVTFMYHATMDNDIIPHLESGEPDKHTLEYGSLDDLFKLRSECTTLLPQLLKY